MEKAQDSWDSFIQGTAYVTQQALNIVRNTFPLLHDNAILPVISEFNTIAHFSHYHGRWEQPSPWKLCICYNGGQTEVRQEGGLENQSFHETN